MTNKNFRRYVAVYVGDSFVDTQFRVLVTLQMYDQCGYQLRMCSRIRISATQ